jgi:hypothetical protein
VVCGGAVLGAGAGALLTGAALGALACPAWWRRCRFGWLGPAAVDGAAWLLAAGAGRGALAGWLLAVACVVPGRMNATAPAVTTPATPTVAVAARR